MLKCRNQFVDGARDVRGEAWEDMVVGEEAYGFSLTNTACVGAPDIKTAVVFWS